MSSKQSCFKSIIVCDLKRSWWVSALAALFIFMSSTSPLFSYSRGYSFYGYSRYDTIVDFCEGMFGNYLIGMCVAAFIVLFIFSYLNKVNSVSFFHSLPAKRSTLLTAHITSSAIIITFPMLINTLISFFAVGRGVKASWVLLSFAMYLVYSFVIFSVTLVITMLTGVSMAGGIFSLVMVFLPVFVLTFINELCSDYLYGFYDYSFFENILLNWIYLAPEKLASARILIYIAFIAVFIGLSYLIYNKRHLENFGEVIAFTNLKGLFKVLFGLCSGVLSYYYFESFWNISSILTMFVFGILGVIIAHMLANRSFNLKGVFTPLIVTCVIIVLLFVTFFFDITGFETRMPDREDVEYAEINGLFYEKYEYVDSDIFGEGRIRAKEKDSFIPYFTSDEEIGYFLELHKYAIDHQDENDNWNDDFITPRYRIAQRRTFTFKYILKNGKTMTRSYHLPVNELSAFTSKIYGSDTYKKWQYPIIDGTEKQYTYFNIVDRRNYNDTPVYVSASSENGKRILEAIRKDREDITYAEMEANDYGQLISIDVNYTKVYVTEGGKEHSVAETNVYAIGKNDVNTWALLEELNLFEDIKQISADNVKSAEVTLNDYVDTTSPDYDDSVVHYASAANLKEKYYYDEDYTYEVSYTNEYTEFTEREDLEALCDLFLTYHNPPVEEDVYANIYISLDLDDETTRSRNVLIKLSELPNVLEYLKTDFER